jgi:hypothetical protein
LGFLLGQQLRGFVQGILEILGFCRVLWLGRFGRRGRFGGFWSWSGLGFIRAASCR